MKVRLATANLSIGSAALASPPPWLASLTKTPPGNVSEQRPLRAIYHFGWSGLTAATAEAHFSRISPDRLQIEGAGRTIGMARALWHYDVTYKTIDNSHTLMP